MFSRFLRRYPPRKLVLLGLDVVSVELAALAAIWLRYSSGLFPEISTRFVLTKFLLLSSCALPLFVLFRHFGLYKSRVYRTVGRQNVEILKGWLGTTLVLVSLIFFLRGNYIQHSRFLVSAFAALLLVLLFIFRMALYRRFVAKLLVDFLKPSRTLIIGTGDAASQVMSRIVATEDISVDVLGFISPDGGGEEKEIFGKRVLGSLDDLEGAVTTHEADQVIIAIEDAGYEEMLGVLSAARKTGLPVGAYSDHFRVVLNDGYLREYAGVDLVVFHQRTSPSFLAVAAKRAADIVGSLVLLVILLPVLVVISLLTKLSSRGPVFHISQAVGKNGELFMWYKFRTMSAGATDNVHREHVRRLILDGRVVANKIPDDPRVSRFGRFLRRHSLDELPQLFNVLRGEMSLVGPRPCLIYEYEMYREWQKRRMSIRPGITGLWQVSGRSNVSINDMVALDLYYIDNYTIWLDFQILLRTLWVVLSGKGGT